MAAYNKFNIFTKDLLEKVHNFTTDNIKVMLTDVAPVATNTIKSNITDIAAGNGYTAGGSQATFVSDVNTSGTTKLVLNPVVFTAAGGSFAQFRYAVLYNSTPANGNLIAWWDFGAEVNLTNSNTFTVSLDATNGVFTIT